MNALTLGVVGIIVLCIAIGYVKVFAEYVTHVIIAVLSIVLVIFFAPFLARQIEKYTKIDDYAEKAISGIVDEDIVRKVSNDYWLDTQQTLSDDPGLMKSMIDKAYFINPKQTARVNIIRYLGFPKGMTNVMIEHVSKFDKTKINETDFSDYVARFFVARLMLIVSALIVANVIFGALTGLNRFKQNNVNTNTIIVGRMNQIGGAFLGAFVGLLVVWGLLVVFQHTNSPEFTIDIINQIKGSPILSYINKNNVLTTLYNWLNYS